MIPKARSHLLVGNIFAGSILVVTLRASDPESAGTNEIRMSYDHWTAYYINIFSPSQNPDLNPEHNV